jgi:hypothetical protein
MKSVNLSKISPTECQGIQINGLSHCVKINCKWQGLSACLGKEIIRTGYNLKGYKVGQEGFV